MKRILFTIVLILSVGLGSEANAQDRTNAMQEWVNDSLKTGTIDTIRVSPLSNTNVAFYQVTAWANTNDTLDVAMVVPDGSRYIKRAVVNLSTGAVSDEMILTTTPKDFVVLGGLTRSLEFTSPGSTNAIYFIVSGRTGQLALASPLTVTIVGALPQDSLNVKLAKKDTLGSAGATYWTAEKGRADSAYRKAQEGLWSADTSVFTTTALQKAVYIVGCLQGDIFVVTPRYLSGATPVAGDLLSYWAKPDSLIVTRAVGTTSGLKFSWMRKTK